MDESKKPSNVIPIRLKSINDLARMASSTTLMMQPTYVVRYRDDKGKLILGFLAVFRDFYNYYGLPLFYYCLVDERFASGNYLIVRSDESGEKVELSKSPKPGFVSVPIIDLDKAPEFLFPKGID